MLAFWVIASAVSGVIASAVSGLGAVAVLEPMLTFTHYMYNLPQICH